MVSDSHPPLLAVRDLRIDRGGQCLIAGLSFELRRGAMLVLRGPNGSGKTSLLRALAGIGPVHSGKVEANGVAQDAEPSQYGANIAYWGHRDGLKEGQRAIDALRQWQGLSGATLSTSDAAALLVRVGLGERATFPIRTFSAGQRRRVGLARLLARQASIWLMDEPFTALDSAGKSLLGEAMAEHRRAGGGVIAALHDAFDGEGIETLTLGVAQDEAAA
ncbi:MAG: heme ABC exporter ATP-binding protein CcmA [Pseudomonadota bacterium]